MRERAPFEAGSGTFHAGFDASADLRGASVAGVNAMVGTCDGMSTGAGCGAGAVTTGAGCGMTGWASAIWTGSGAGFVDATAAGPKATRISSPTAAMSYSVLCARSTTTRAMVGWNEPLAYRHHREWGELLSSLGFHVRMVRVPDVLPYPHVVIAATKRD